MKNILTSVSLEVALLMLIKFSTRTFDERLFILVEKRFEILLPEMPPAGPYEKLLGPFGMFLGPYRTFLGPFSILIELFASLSTLQYSIR